MFGVFGGKTGFSFSTSSSAALEVIERLKESARGELEKYDNIIASQNNSEIKKRFLENERDCFLGFLDNGFSVLILRRLLEAAPANIKEQFCHLDSWEQEYNLFRDQIELTYISINVMAGIVDLLAISGKLCLSEKAASSLSGNSADFLNDGFDYFCGPEMSEKLRKCEKDAFERMNGAMRETKSYFEKPRLTPEQKLYFDFEMEYLLIILKDYYKGIAYQALLTSEVSPALLEGDEMLIGNSVARIPVVLEMILELTELGIIKLAPNLIADNN